MRKIILSFFFIVCIIPFVASQEIEVIQGKNILILNSYHFSQKWVTKFNNGYCPYINIDSFNLYIEQLNEKRAPITPEINEVLVQHLNARFQDLQFDLIVAIDNAALHFINANVKSLSFINGVQIMAAGINDFNPSMIANIPQTIVLREEGGLQETLIEMLHLMPSLSTIYCVIDYTETGKILQGAIEESINVIHEKYKSKDELTILYNKNIPFVDILEEIRALPENSAVVLILFQRDAHNIYYRSQPVISAILQATDFPIFTGLDIYMDSSIVGGKVTNPEKLGVWLGKSILNYFNNEPIIVDSAYAKEQLEWVFSYPALKKFNIAINQLPPNSNIYFKPIPFFAQYKRLSIILLYTVIATLIVIIIFFIFNKKLAQQVKKQTKNIEDLVGNFEYLRQEMPIGFIELDAEYRVIFWNKSAELIFGYTAEEIKGHNMFDFITMQEKREIVDEIVYGLLQNSSKTYISQSLHNKFRKGEKLQCEWYFTRKKDEKNASVLYMCMVIDITEREKLKLEQETLVNMLKKMMLNQDRFIASSMHDIKNIMAPIVAYSEMMSLYDLPPSKIKDLATRLHKSTNLLSHVFVEMMDISKVKGELIQSVPREFCFKELTNDILAMVEENYKRKEIQIFNLLPEQMVFADYEMIYSVLMNLCTNAIKFTPIKGEISILGKKISDTHFEVQVKDNGVGIDLNKFQLLMSENKYFTTKGTEGEEGTGLGLLLCKELIANNFGTFWAKNNENGGSSFFFTLPINSEASKILKKLQ